MIFKVRAIDHIGSAATVATDDAREALQSLLAFEMARFREVTVCDDAGHLLMASDLIEITRHEPDDRPAESR